MFSFLWFYKNFFCCFWFYKFFCNFLFEMWKHFISGPRTQVPTETNCHECVMNTNYYHKENQCLMLRYELDVLTVVIRYITTKCLHEWTIVHWEWNIRSEYSRIVLDWRLLLVWSGLYVPTCRAISQQRLIYPMPFLQGLVIQNAAYK